MSIMLPQLTVLVITYNEERNIARTLESVSFAGRILVVDSFSTDKTLEIVAQYPQAEVMQREFTTFAEQCNFGLEHVASEWVLSLDADYVLPEEASAAISRAMETSVPFYEVAFDYCIEGQPVRGGILPPRVILFRLDTARYIDDGHGHRLNIVHPPARLPFRVRHDDRKPLNRWLQSQFKYAQLEADKLSQAAFRDLGTNDRIRKLVIIAPPAVFLLVYVLRGGFLSGWRGFFYAIQRFTAELLLSLFLLERKTKQGTS